MLLSTVRRQSSACVFRRTLSQCSARRASDVSHVCRRHWGQSLQTQFAGDEVLPSGPCPRSRDTLAERLRRRPAKPMGSPCVGSNPTGVAFSLSVHVANMNQVRFRAQLKGQSRPLYNSALWFARGGGCAHDRKHSINTLFMLRRYSEEDPSSQPFPLKGMALSIMPHNKHLRRNMSGNESVEMRPWAGGASRKLCRERQHLPST